MRKSFIAIFLLAISLFVFTSTAQAQNEIPKDEEKKEATIDLNETVGSSKPLQIVVLLTVMSFIPALLISMTCFTRLIVVFHFLRQALGTQETPNNQVLIGLALFITLFAMSPTFNQIYEQAFKPMMDGEISQTEALEKGIKPLRSYMLKQTRERDLALFIRLSKSARPQTADDVPTTSLIPAYMISELKTAFQIGFVLFLPFLVIDLAVRVEVVFQDDRAEVADGGLFGTGVEGDLGAETEAIAHTRKAGFGKKRGNTKKKKQ